MVLRWQHFHLTGQLSEGDDRAAWLRLLHSHAEETHGAQAHYLQELMGRSYSRVTGQRCVGRARTYAERLQEINKLYQLSSGSCVLPEMLMSRLLALPPSYDSVVKVIEAQSGTMASDGRGPLDLHEVRARVVQYENRCIRRNKLTQREVPLQREHERR